MRGRIGYGAGSENYSVHWAAGNLSTLYAMEPVFEVRQTFYGCAASFTKYLVEQIGLERVIDVLPEDDPHKKLEQITRVKIGPLRMSWLTKIGAARFDDRAARLY